MTFNLISTKALMSKSPLYYILCYLIISSFFQTAFAAVLVKDKMWPNHSVLNVVFIDGNKQQKQQVILYAPLWLVDSGLSLKFFDSFANAPDKTHIRVSFNSHTGSQLGNHGDYWSKQPTLLLNQLNQQDLPDASIRRLILHEFGHALGFEHAYRNPKWPFGQQAIDRQINDCTPRLEKIGYSYSEAQRKCVEINSPLIKHQVYTTIYDENSIMNYPQKIVLKNKKVKYIQAKTQLSVLDHLAIQQWYGKNKT